MKIHWPFGIIAGIILAIFSLYPQMKMVYLRGADWNGHYAYNDIDEVAYASYLKALIDGRPRKNDPYTGRDDSPDSPQPESLFSIQFAGPYTIAIPARVLGIPATWAMTISGAVAAFLTALVIFWLIWSMTRDPLYGMAAAIIVLAGGALFAGEGALSELLGGFAYPYFPGFRRYIPAMAMPALFALMALVWKLLGTSGAARESGSGSTAQSLFSRKVLVYLALAILAFSYTVFSYFYIWTTAVAWLGCITLLWALVRPPSVWKDIKLLALLGAGCVLALIPYAYLLSKRSHTMDDVQLLVITHAPDLTRTPELIGFAVLLAILAGAVLGLFSLRDKASLFVASLAITPAILFNQQVVTGQSLQPIHYQVFVGNYVAGLALAGTFGLIWRRVEWRNSRAGKLLVAAVAVIAVSWGFVECHYTVRVLDDVNVIRDEHLPVGRRLAELGKGQLGVHEQAVLHFGIAEADDLPTIAPQSVLWSRHQHVFAGVSWQENKERYYQQLYYSEIEPAQLAQGIKDGRDIVSLIALFGWGRHTDRLNSDYKPLRYGEIDDEANAFADYVKRFDARSAEAVRLSYLVVPADSADAPLENLDRWYERYDREDIGKYTLYKLRLR